MANIFSPSHNTFRKEGSEEKTILVTRKHRVNLWAPLYTVLGLTFVPLVIYFVISSLKWYELIAPLYHFLTIVYFLFLWNLAFYHLTVYFLNTVIVTNKRVIENEQNGFFDHTTNEVALNKIEDVSVRRKGTLAHFWNFGELEIQSAGAGAEKEIFFTQLPDPDKVKETIMELIIEK